MRPLQFAVLSVLSLCLFLSCATTSVQTDRGVRVVGQLKARGFYGENWAVIIGIDDYDHWPKLSYAVKDARGVREALVEQLDFNTKNVYELYDKDAIER